MLAFVLEDYTLTMFSNSCRFKCLAKFSRARITAILMTATLRLSQVRESSRGSSCFVATWMKAVYWNTVGYNSIRFHNFGASLHFCLLILLWNNRLFIQLQLKNYTMFLPSLILLKSRCQTLLSFQSLHMCRTSHHLISDIRFHLYHLNTHRCTWPHTQTDV